jgi:hypothetical protein
MRHIEIYIAAWVAEEEHRRAAEAETLAPCPSGRKRRALVRRDHA